MSMRLNDRARPYLSPALYGPPEIPEPQPMSPTAAGCAMAWLMALSNGLDAESRRQHFREWLCMNDQDDLIDAITRFLLDPETHRRGLAAVHKAIQAEAARLLEEE